MYSTLLHFSPNKRSAIFSYKFLRFALLYTDSFDTAEKTEFERNVVGREGRVGWDREAGN